jgi:hypothetical protein
LGHKKIEKISPKKSRSRLLVFRPSGGNLRAIIGEILMAKLDRVIAGEMIGRDRGDPAVTHGPLAVFR